MSRFSRSVVPVTAGVVLALAGCGSGGSSSASPTPGPGIGGDIAIDGSSTVGPILAATAELFQEQNPDSEPTVAMSGTSGGFKKLIAGETDIAGASRPVKPEEIEKLKAAGIEFIEIPVAMDGLTVVVNNANTWAKSLTVEELKKIWEPGSEVNNWSQVRAGFPNEPLKLFGAGTDSGTFDYFTLAINGEEKASRDDYTPSEDDNVLVAGVKGEKGGLGYFGFSYYEANQDDLTAVAIDAGKGPVAPSHQATLDGSYAPLSRPLLIYVNKSSFESKPQVKAFVEFLLENNAEAAKLAHYIPLSPEVIDLAKKRVVGKLSGSVFHGTQTGISISDLLKAEQG